MNQAERERALMGVWPWATEVVRHLRTVRPAPFHGGHLVFGSDYSGDHSESHYKVYGFVVADADALGEWAARCRKVRQDLLPDRRRMAFKRLSDRHRQRALCPFLEAAEFIEGHVVGIVVTKRLAHLCTARGTMDLWQRLHPLQAGWDEKAFEQMVRVTHFFSLFLAAWSSPGTDVSWITDNDQIVANAERLVDAQQSAERMTRLYVPHRLGKFMMNTVAIDGPERELEDLLAIPDLAAGMLGELISVAPRPPVDVGRRVFADDGLRDKSTVLADWFWHVGGSLKKTCILIDQVSPNVFCARELKRDSQVSE